MLHGLLAWAKCGGCCNSVEQTPYEPIITVAAAPVASSPAQASKSRFQHVEATLALASSRPTTSAQLVLVEPAPASAPLAVPAPVSEPLSSGPNPPVGDATAAPACVGAPVKVTTEAVEFTMKLEPSVGIDFDDGDRQAVIVTNVRGATSCQLQHADRIVQIDGDRSFAGIVAKLGERLAYDIEVQRPEEIEVILKKTPLTSKIGAVIAQASGKSLWVKKVREGMIDDWNKEHPAYAIKPGDRIVAVNGNRLSSEKLLAEIRNAQEEPMVCHVCRMSAN